MTGAAAHPGLVLLATALLSSLAGARARRAISLLGCASALVVWGGLDESSSFDLVVSEYRLDLLRVDAASRLFGLVFCLAAFIGSVYALHRDSRGESAATLAYAGSSLGAVFAGDFVTLFAFWELMAVFSLLLVWKGGTERAAASGFRYLLVHIAGGSLLFAGILVHLDRGGSLAIEPLAAAGADPLAFWLVLLGVSVNAAIPPLHAWLADSYPEASVVGSVFLSAFTTKTAVYVLLRLYPGAEILVWAGAAMAIYGVVYAVLENDIRRLLAYHIVSQVGYMVAGVGLGSALALDGAAAHAFSHILYKGLLFMGVGAVIHATGAHKLTELGGIAPSMKAVVCLYAVGAFSISGVPLFNGFISKSMVISAAAESHRAGIELLLTIASVGMFLHTGLKLPYFTFLSKASRPLAVRPVPRNMIAAMGMAALLCTAYGVLPGLLYRMLPYGTSYHPYDLDHLLSSIQLLSGTAVVFFLLRDKLGGEATVSLDTDWFYRVPLPRMMDAAVSGARRAGGAASAAALASIDAFSRAFSRPESDLDPDYDPNRFRSPIGDTVFWIALFFAVLTIAAYFGSELY